MMENTNLNENEQKEKEKDTGVQQETSTENSNDGKHEIDVINEAKKIQDGMKAENDRKQKLLDREEKLLARQEALKALGGGSPAGQQAKPKEKTSKEYADEVMTGKIRAS